ncbi:hypothetical protein O3P69_010942 [Scylla paramamosain]|uniref:Uncharacterized protein n=1 Tax=Scylla paramamosain TaxID=85552 RepID=A0AAW0SB41_SCYPA
METQAANYNRLYSCYEGLPHKVHQEKDPSGHQRKAASDPGRHTEVREQLLDMTEKKSHVYLGGIQTMHYRTFED